jgi:hypothetical protein
MIAPALARSSAEVQKVNKNHASDTNNSPTPFLNLTSSQ